MTGFICEFFSLHIATVAFKYLLYKLFVSLQ